MFKKKKNKNRNLIIIMIIIFLIFVFLNLKFVFKPNNSSDMNDRLIGGDKDDHGCLIGAGYSWCPSSEKCLRVWEEYCEEFKDSFRGGERDCETRELNDCDNDCTVCPPCSACSSFSCKSKDFCAKQGIDETWYDGIQAKVNSFSECIGAGNPALESYPRQCNTKDGRNFIEEIK